MITVFFFPAPLLLAFFASAVRAFYTADWIKAFENFSDPYDGRPPTIEQVPTRVPLRNCVNRPLTRACWTAGFSIADDFDTKWPNTGKIRYYNWDVQNVTLAPDGFERMILAINGQYPGPTLYADWGDTIVVNLRNLMQDNGTTIHWHGMRMFQTNPQDGVPGLTECPLAPGESKTYVFYATQYGTSWYHSHFEAQYGDGVLGPIIINGPTTANYDEDLGALPITDWFHTPIGTVAYKAARSHGPPPSADNGLINGTMAAPKGATGGAYHLTRIKHGKRYRLRLINTAINDQYQVSLDSHELLTHWLFLGIGQRYDVVINANQSIANYWFRAEVQDLALCGSNKNNGNIRSIFSYEGAKDENPKSTSVPYTQSCADPPASSLVPFWNSFVPKSNLIEGRLNAAVQLGVSQEDEAIVKWGVNLSAMHVDWTKPTLQHVFAGSGDFTPDDNLIMLPEQSKWYYWIIQEVAGVPPNINVPHPIHLHGHDFYVLGTGSGSFSAADRANLNFNNPPRRDTAVLPAEGWLVTAFQTDNPGAWLWHCHIAWHSEMGFAVQFIEAADAARDLIVGHREEFDNTCEKWNSYYPNNSYYRRHEYESGI